jgi:hypothetical protein
MLKTQLQLLNQQLQNLMEKRNRRKKRRAMLPSTPLSSTQFAQKPKKKKNPEKKTKKATEDFDEKIPEEITYEQKRELSDNINILPPEKLPQVFEIIKENTQLNVISN